MLDRRTGWQPRRARIVEHDERLAYGIDDGFFEGATLLPAGHGIFPPTLARVHDAIGDGCWCKAIAVESRDLSCSLDGSDVNPEVACYDNPHNDYANDIENT